MSRAGSVMLGAGVVGEQNSLVNETHLLTLWYLWCIVVVVKKSRGRVGSRTFIQDQVGVAETFWDHFGVAKRKVLGTAVLLKETEQGQ